jgi:hypothetical protein
MSKAMELTYTCEKSEKETVALAMRPFRRYFRTMFAASAAMFVLACVYAVAELMVKGLPAPAPDGVSLGAFFLSMSLTIALIGWIRLRRFRRGVIDTYRKRKTNLAEYRLSDEGLYCAHGESKATMPWSEFARFRIDPDALYLQAPNGYIACVPDWSGRGVDGAELAAVLEKAGLKRMGASKARRLTLGAIVAAMVAVILFCAVSNICDSWRTLRTHIVGIELKRQLHELVCGDGNKGDNPYSYSRYWKVRCNSVQRLATMRCKFAFGKRYYIFDKNDDDEKVGLAATEGDKLWCVCLPCGSFCHYDLAKFEELKGSGLFRDSYPESDLNKWLEQVRPLAEELREENDGTEKN